MGGLWSCIDDLVVWMAWLDDAFPARDGFDDGPLRRSSRRELQQVHRATRVTRSAPTGEGLDHVPERIDGGGYGFGHQVLHDDRFGTIVGHSGGLPGYGSNMRWLPGRRIGAVALANSTYAPMRLLTRRMLELLDDHGLVPSADAPAPRQLLSAAAHLVALLNDWSDAAADALFTDNVALDESYERRAATAAALTSSHGSLTVEDVVARTAAAATITFRAGRRARRHDRADAVAPGAVTGPGVRAPLTGCAALVLRCEHLGRGIDRRPGCRSRRRRVTRVEPMTVLVVILAVLAVAAAGRDPRHPVAARGATQADRRRRGTRDPAGGRAGHDDCHPRGDGPPAGRGRRAAGGCRSAGGGGRGRGRGGPPRGGGGGGRAAGRRGARRGRRAAGQRVRRGAGRHRRWRHRSARAVDPRAGAQRAHLASERGARPGRGVGVRRRLGPAAGGAAGRARRSSRGRRGDRRVGRRAPDWRDSRPDRSSPCAPPRSCWPVSCGGPR